MCLDVTTDNVNFANSTTISTDDGTVIAKKKNHSEFMGMFKSSVEDDPIVVRNLINGNQYLVLKILNEFNLKLYYRIAT